MADEMIDLKALQKKLTPGVMLGLIAIILLLITAFDSFYVVDQKETAVILRLGKYYGKNGPGIHNKLPFGIDKNYNVPTGRELKEEFGFRTRKISKLELYSRRDYSGESHMMCGDLKMAEVTWTIRYRIRDPKAWLFNVENQIKTIRDISQSVINMLVGDLALIDVLTTGRVRIEENGKRMMNEFYTSYGLGIEVTEVLLHKIIPTGEKEKGEAGK